MEVNPLLHGPLSSWPVEWTYWDAWYPVWLSDIHRWAWAWPWKRVGVLYYTNYEWSVQHEFGDYPFTWYRTLSDPFWRGA